MEANDSGDVPPPLRLVNFVSEEQLDLAKKTRGERVDDGTAERSKPLYEILKENKDKKDAEFQERFKHRPPKALDEDETEFLDKLDMSKKGYEQHLADEEAQQLRKFQEAVAAQSSIVRELKDAPAVIRTEEQKLGPKRSQSTRLSNLIIAIKPQPKKAKTDAGSDKSSEAQKLSNGSTANQPSDPSIAGLGGLVSYSDESETDD